MDLWIRVNRASPVNPFLRYDLRITLPSGFPTEPFGALREKAQKVVRLQHREAMDLPGVFPLTVNSVTERSTGSIPRRRVIQLAMNTEGAERIVTEPNGISIGIARGEKWWRKYTFAIDFGRTNQELGDDFAEFLKKARKNRSLRRSVRLSKRSRRDLPHFFNPRFASDALRSLGACRAIQAHNGDLKAAFEFMKSQSGTKGPFERSSEMNRAAKKVPAFLRKIFRPARLKA
jgi:hypothetical protein